MSVSFSIIGDVAVDAVVEIGVETGIATGVETVVEVAVVVFVVDDDVVGQGSCSIFFQLHGTCLAIFSSPIDLSYQFTPYMSKSAGIDRYTMVFKQ